MGPLPEGRQRPERSVLLECVRQEHDETPVLDVEAGETAAGRSAAGACPRAQAAIERWSSKARVIAAGARPVANWPVAARR